jgi:hypothetical protein
MAQEENNPSYPKLPRNTVNRYGKPRGMTFLWNFPIYLIPFISFSVMCESFFFLIG